MQQEWITPFSFAQRHGVRLGPCQHVRRTNNRADIVQHAGKAAGFFIKAELPANSGALLCDRLHMRKRFGPAVGQQEFFRGQHLGQMNVVKGFQHNMS